MSSIGKRYSFVRDLRLIIMNDEQMMLDVNKMSRYFKKIQKLSLRFEQYVSPVVFENFMEKTVNLYSIKYLKLHDEFNNNDHGDIRSHALPQNTVVYGERKPRPGYSFYNDQFCTAGQIKFVTDGYRHSKFYCLIFYSDPYPNKCFYHQYVGTFLYIAFLSSLLISLFTNYCIFFLNFF